MKLIFVLILSFISIQSKAQFLKSLMKETTDKVADKVAERVADRVADEIAYAIMKPIDKALDSLLRHSYEADSLSGNRTYGDYSTFLSGMDRSADVPENYVFDVVIQSEVEDDKKKKSEVSFFYTKSGDYFGMGQKDNFMVMDSKNDLIVTFDNEKNEAFALPNVMKVGAIYASQELKDEMADLNYEKTGKTKKICGYKCIEYIFYDKEENEESKNYIAEDFPVSWQDAYGGMMSEMMPALDRGEWNDIKGMALRADTKRDSKQVSKWEAKKIDLDGLKISKSDYKFDSYADKEK